MIDSKSSANLLQDYLLGLLPPAAKRQVEQQIANDPTLLSKLQQERQVEKLVKGTLHQVGQIENGRLTQLMPAIPKRQPKLAWNGALSRQLAMAAMLFLLLFGGWQWYNNQPTLWPTQPTHVAVTATLTNTPAPTETQVTAPTETAVAKQTVPTAVMTPEPPPTPIAAVSINTN
ncbi:hypothetical protein MNBD_CHLOROFLEXI01-847 [hydrothermal vent metagenome]|uniref:Uncharacterized protein n=1 Tax=hydrothermal vent metagenome TaxID=652676 RepID=A0A3B0UJZ8_9ZZZZ